MFRSLGAKRQKFPKKATKKPPNRVCRIGGKVAGSTGLEPAASGVTGRRYNQLNYHPIKQRTFIHDPVRTVNTAPEVEMRYDGRNGRVKPCVLP